MNGKRLAIGGDLSAAELRRLARREPDRAAAARMQAIAGALEGMTRAEAARLAGMERQALRDAVPKLALSAPIPGGGQLRDIAGAVLDIAHGGLKARARLSGAGEDETGFLEPLREIVRAGKVPAERLLDLYHGAWGGDVSHVYGDASF